MGWHSHSDVLLAPSPCRAGWRAAAEGSEQVVSAHAVCWARAPPQGRVPGAEAAAGERVDDPQIVGTQHKQRHTCCTARCSYQELPGPAAGERVDDPQISAKVTARRHMLSALCRAGGHEAGPAAGHH
jgi:hypothetical protein